MKVPLEVSYRNVEKTNDLETLVREKVGKLEQVCDHISSCRVVVEKANERPKSGSPYRVSIDLTVPPSHELAAVENPGQGTQYVPLETVIRHAFDAARRQLVELSDRQNDAVKTHPEQEMTAIVTKLFPEQGYGFIKSLTGEDVYFHENSVVNHDFDRIDVGTGVHFVAVEGEQGLQATTVHIVDKAGAHIPPSTDEAPVKPPMGWE
ncbi:MAG: cold shock domain-containing protein [Kastovskya adunca ATA6-11-RM4]|jgi:cold shock CspA family protein/ribosome-associated translation inhibitor RaiA|nr:cold shock domain-containing protein [Kastovskya adunca ATA6-11-RM4]